MYVVDNERADCIAKVASRSSFKPIKRISFFDLVLHFFKVIMNAWRFLQRTLPTSSLANRFTFICLDFRRFSWFLHIHFSKFCIISFSKLKFGSNRLTLNLNWNCSLYCPRCDEIDVCYYTIFFYTTFLSKGKNLFIQLPLS